MNGVVLRPSFRPSGPPRPELLAEAVADQGPVFVREDLVRWFESHVPGVDPLWIEGRVTGDTVNDRERRHVPGPRDLLYLRDDGRYERYHPADHGWWSKAGTPQPQGRPVVHLADVRSAPGGHDPTGHHPHRHPRAV